MIFAFEGESRLRYFVMMFHIFVFEQKKSDRTVLSDLHDVKKVLKCGKTSFDKKIKNETKSKYMLCSH